MSIELHCNPVIKNINARTLGGEDDRIVWADIKMHASIHPGELDQFVEGVSRALWAPVKAGEDDIGEPVLELQVRLPLLNQQTVKGKWENINCKLAPDPSFLDDDEPTDTFEGGVIHKLKFDPMCDSAYLEFEYTVQIPGMEIGSLIDRVLGETVAVYLYHNQGELDL